MSDRQPVRVVLDVGKTNKKCLVFGADGALLQERLVSLSALVLPDGRHAEDLRALTEWMDDAVADACRNSAWDVGYINFCGYGATWVHLDVHGNPVIQPEDYLDPFPDELIQSFEAAHGSRAEVSRETASPWLGNLNSGLQLFRLKHTRPDAFGKIHVSLHLPQFLSWHFTQTPVSEITSVGCHSMLWDFGRSSYHRWVQTEGLDRLQAPLTGARTSFNTPLHGSVRSIGIGMHDSSAALVPYLSTQQAPFLLVSTGTWSIALNPFNEQPLTAGELQQDCLCYLTPEGRQVKAARYFIGPDHDAVVARIAERFQCDPGFYTAVKFDATIADRLDAHPDPMSCTTIAEAYHASMLELVTKQRAAIHLAAGSHIPKTIFVDGGFGRNDVFLSLLSCAFPGVSIHAADMPQASARGACEVGSV